MKKIMVFLVCLLLLGNVSAEKPEKSTLDVYGADSRESEKLIKKYGKDITLLVDEAFAEIQASSGDDSKKMEKLSQQKKRLLESIKNHEGFLYANMSTVFYPNDKTVHNTLEVITREQPQRMRFLDSGAPEKKQPPQSDVIAKMIKFNALEQSLVLNNRINLKDNSCPVYYCGTGFHHPELKPWLAVFNKAAISDRALILDTLKQDPSAERRAAAVYLMGHFKNPREIISLLSPHVNDSDAEVRNAVIGVMMATMHKAHITDINVQPFITLLSSPLLSDRNQSLLVLLQVAANKSLQKEIITQGGNHLIALLELKQPNNHLPAYHILKTISGKSFGENDIASWQKWVSHYSH